MRGGRTRSGLAEATFARIRAIGLALCLLLAAVPGALAAEVLGQADVQALLPEGIVVGEKSLTLPVWPLYARGEASRELIGHAFESVAFEPARGYSGKPINLFVAIDRRGRFLAARMLSHREPIFLGERTRGLLDAYVRQYEGLSLDQSIRTVGPDEPVARDATSATLNGVLRGTVSTTAIDRGVIRSALAVAQAMADAAGAAAGGAGGPAGSGTGGGAPEPVVTLPPWPRLVATGVVLRHAVRLGDIETALASTRAGSRPLAAGQTAEDLAIELQVAPIGLEAVGRGMLDASGWAQLQGRLEPGQAAVLVLTRGPQVFAGTAYSAAATSLRLSLRQAGRPLRLEPIDYRGPLRVPREHDDLRATVHRVVGDAPLDFAAPFEVVVSVARRFGADALQRSVADLSIPYRLPMAEVAAWSAPTPAPARAGDAGAGHASGAEDAPGAGWRGVWHDRRVDLAVLLASLGLLTVLLARPGWITSDARRLAALRLGFLVYTAVFIGWLAQGQLTVVTLVAAIEAAATHGNFAFLLSDPMAVVLWLFVGLTLVAWGRGTFCGWLCPFGALQEIVSRAARALGLRPRRLPVALDRRLKHLKYGVLAALVGGAALALPVIDTAVEVEPFKTAISLMFAREWPYVAWAVGCLVASIVYYRGFCRYLCPLGAALALAGGAVGAVRARGWIARRAACGQPCQSCRYRCDYQAIAPGGAIDYRECFQCLDCVVLYRDDRKCLPLVRMKRAAAGPKRGPTADPATDPAVGEGWRPVSRA